MGKTLLCFCLCAISVWTCAGWHDRVHQMVTRAALASLPAGAQERFGAETTALVRKYCVYPDMYPHRTAARAEMRRYCEMPDGRPIHTMSHGPSRTTSAPSSTRSPE